MGTSRDRTPRCSPEVRSGRCSPRAPTLEAAQGEADPLGRVEIWKQIQRLALSDLPLVNVFAYRWLGIRGKNLRSVTDTCIHSQNNFAQVWFDRPA
ncbi:hypothetical protein OPKNFCMD_2175 [Methylobacterium crusticola]|uniref:Uncharacterized protein n=1 Tax=Methylobacterium crusticola TaxID=1697972 RepID=A0ABQ4QX41_9HYPH|nr:hypothetical protein OPKNFCMD_2175 [Methylobacterium crusticola]